MPQINQHTYVSVFLFSILGWLCIMHLPGSAQNIGHKQFFFDSFTINEGVSESIVSAVAEDKYGAICLGTEKGLDLFNGYEFEHITNTIRQENDIGGLSDLGMIRQITPMANGYLFIIGHNQHCYFFNPADRSFIGLDTLINLDTNSSERVSHEAITQPNCIYHSQHGDYWIGTEDGLLMASYGRETFPGIPRFTRILAGQGYRIRTLTEDNQKRIWALTEKNDILIIDPQTKRVLYHVAPSDLGMKDKSNQTVVLYSGSSRDIWIAAYGGVYYFEGIKDQRPAFDRLQLDYGNKQFSHLNVNCLLRDAGGLLWIGTQSRGILLYDVYAGKMVDHLTQTPFYPRSLNSNTIYCLMEDSHQRIWIGTDDGMNKYDRYTQKFALYDQDRTDPSKKLSLVFDILGVDSQHLMTISKGQPVLLNTVTHQLDYLGFHGKEPSDMRFRCLDRDSSGTIWGATSTGLRTIQKIKSKYVIKPVSAPELQSLKYLHLNDILLVGDSLMWIGTIDDGGLYLWNRRSHTVTRFKHDKDRPHSICDNNINHIIRDRKGQIWLGTYNGISRYDNQKKQFDNFLDVSHGRKKAPMYVQYIFDDGQYFWIATFNGGLIQFDPVTQHQARYTTADGLPDNTLYGCVSDDSGHLWISSNKGVSQFFIQDKRFRNFTKDDGLQSDEFDGKSVYKNRKGEIFFGGIYGINKIDPAYIDMDTLAVPVEVSNISVLSTEGGYDIFPGDRRSFEFPYWQNMLLFQFTALNFIDPSANRYQYRLKGLDMGWAEAGNKHSVIYSHLPPGNYTFQVSALNEDGIWNSAPLSLSITIRPPFWQTGWFKVLVVMCGIILLYGIFRLRLKAVRVAHQAKIEKTSLSRKIIQLEKMALQAQMNPHFIFNSLNSIKAYILSSEQDEAVEYLNDFAALMRKILQHSKREKISLVEELEAIERYVKLEARRLHKPVNLIVKSEEDTSLSHIFIPPLIIQPFIENAIWHGIRPRQGEGRIEILIREEVALLKVCITDNGVGRQKARMYRNSQFKTQSMGVSITQERLSHFNGEKIENIQYEDIPEHQGTRVTLWIHRDNID